SARSSDGDRASTRPAPGTAARSGSAVGTARARLPQAAVGACALDAGMRISAVVLREPGRPVAVEQVELDAPKAEEVLVRVAAAGVCHSDVRLADGELGA